MLYCSFLITLYPLYIPLQPGFCFHYTDDTILLKVDKILDYQSLQALLLKYFIDLTVVFDIVHYILQHFLFLWFPWYSKILVNLLHLWLFCLFWAFLFLWSKWISVHSHSYTVFLTQGNSKFIWLRYFCIFMIKISWEKIYFLWSDTNIHTFHIFLCVCERKRKGERKRVTVFIIFLSYLTLVKKSILQFGNDTTISRVRHIGIILTFNTFFLPNFNWSLTSWIFCTKKYFSCSLYSIKKV